MSTDNEVHGLTAGYAVNALTAEERARAEEHLAECEDCRRDLAEFRATTVRLAYAEAQPPGEHVWRRLRSAVPGVRQLPPETSEKTPPRAPAAVTSLSRRRRALPWLVAAACLFLAAAMGGLNVAMSQRMDEMRAHTAEVEALLMASDARMKEASVARSDARATVFASEQKDSVMIVVEGLPEAPDGMAYQMWLVNDGDMRSGGMLEEYSEGMLSGMSKELGTSDQIGISLEPDYGMPEPSEEPMKVEL